MKNMKIGTVTGGSIKTRPRKKNFNLTLNVKDPYIKKMGMGGKSYTKGSYKGKM